MDKKELLDAPKPMEFKVKNKLEAIKAEIEKSSSEINQIQSILQQKIAELNGAFGLAKGLEELIADA